MHLKFYIKYTLLFVLFCICSEIQAQKTKLDSLNLLLDQTKKDTRHKVEDLNLMAKILLEQSNKDLTDKALLYSQQALLLAERINYQQGIGAALYNIGAAYTAQNQFSKSLGYYLKSAKFYRVTNSKSGEAKAYKAIGSIYYEFGDYENSLRYHLKSLDTYRKLKDKNGEASAYSNIGIVYLGLREITKSIESHEKALDIAKEMTNDNVRAISYNNLAIAYTYVGEYKKALELYENALDIFKKKRKKVSIATTLNGMGDVYRKKGRSNKALKYYLNALDILKSEYAPVRVAYAYLGIGSLYLETNNIDRAISYFNNSLRLSQSLNHKELIRNTYKELSRAYQKSKDYSKSLEYHQLFKVYHDSIYNQERLAQIAEMQVKFDLKNKEEDYLLQKRLNIALNKEKLAEEEKAQSQLRRRNTLITFLTVIFAFTVLLIFVLVRGRIINQRKNRILQERNAEIESQKAKIEKQSEKLRQSLIKLKDSVHYAETMQRTILPSQDKMSEILPHHFAILKPKDIVSGDFYWLNKIGDKTFLALVDCTGHGIPGGFMSMIGHTLLNEIIVQNNVHSPAKILNLLQQGVIHILEKKDEDVAIGMEVALIQITPFISNEVKVVFAGAKRSLFYTLEGSEKITEIRGDREGIGFHLNKYERDYQNIALNLPKGSMLYMSSDGIVDQANPKNKRFGTPKLKRNLQQMAHLPVVEQKTKLIEALRNHQQGAKQRDDITVLGVRV